MKSLLITFLFILLASIFTKVEAQPLPTALDYDYVDTDGNIHNIHDYFEQEKSVFIFYIDTAPSTYFTYEDLNLIDFYNTYGQGGNGDVIVLCMAIDGFETYESLSNLDYSAELGAGYENVSYTANNPIPMIIHPLDMDTTGFEGLFGLAMLCYDEHYEHFTVGNGTEYMNTLYDVCCTALEPYDPGISSYPSSENCDVLTFPYTLTNHAATPFSSTDISVFINGTYNSQFTISQTIDGCSNATFQYANPILAEADYVRLAIANTNTNTSNDTIDRVIQNMDTISGRIRATIENPTEPWAHGDLYGSGDPGDYVNFGESSNYQGEIYLAEGCHWLSATGYATAGSIATALITTIDPFGNTIDTLYMNTEEVSSSSDSLIDYSEWVYVGQSASPLISGYIFEDEDITQSFSPEMARIAGVEVNHGPYTTFSDANGYYQLPLDNPGGTISIEYDENIWQVITSPNPLSYDPGMGAYNFGLNSDEPVYGLGFLFDPNFPILCNNELTQQITIQNTGNQATNGELVVTYDPQLSFISASDLPTTINGNELTFAIPELFINAQYGITLEYAPLDPEMLGDTMATDLALYYANQSSTLMLTDSISEVDSVFCSFDPNDIYGFPLGDGSEGFIPANTPLKYRIRFQNTGNYPATNVVVVNTLPEELDWDSFVPITASHDYTIQMNETTREIRWTFANINLPDSSSNLAESMGTIWYSVDMNDLDQGVQILNQASIFFDSNPPIVTNTSIHTIAGTSGIAEAFGEFAFRLYPNPAHDQVMLTFSTPLVGSAYIYDLLGRECMNVKLSGTEAKLSLDGLKPGMYFISIRNEVSGMVSSAGFMKM